MASRAAGSASGAAGSASGAAGSASGAARACRELRGRVGSCGGASGAAGVCRELGAVRGAGVSGAAGQVRERTVVLTFIKGGCMVDKIDIKRPLCIYMTTSLKYNYYNALKTIQD